MRYATLALPDGRTTAARVTDTGYVLLDAPDWRYLAYHLGGPIVADVVVAGARAELG